MPHAWSGVFDAHHPRCWVQTRGGGLSWLPGMTARTRGNMVISFRNVVIKTLLLAGIASVVSACQSSSPEFRWEAYIDRCRSMVEQNEFARAQELVELAFEECKSCSSKDIKLASTLKTQARIFELQYDFEDKAEIRRKLLEKEAEVCRQWYELTTRVYGPRHADTNEAQAYLARTLVLLSEYSEAKRLLQTSISQLSTKYGDKDLSLASPLHLLGTVFVSQGYPQEGEPHLRRALLIERIYLPEGIDETIDTMLDLAYCIAFTDPKKSETILEEALELCEKHKSTKLYYILVNLANLECDYLRNYDKSEKCLKRILKDDVPMDLTFRLAVQLQLGRIYENRAEKSKASDIYKSVIASYKTDPKACESLVGLAQIGMAELAFAKGDYHQALEFARTATKHETSRMKQSDVATIFHVYRLIAKTNCRLHNTADEQVAIQNAFDFFLDHRLSGKVLRDQQALTEEGYGLICHFAVRHANLDWGKGKFENALKVLTKQLGAESLDVATASYIYGKYLQSFAEHQRSPEIYREAERRFDDALQCPTFQHEKNGVYWGSLWCSSECSYFLGHWSLAEKRLREVIASKYYSKKFEDGAQQRLKVVLGKQGKSL